MEAKRIDRDILMAGWLSKEEHEKRIKRVIELRDKYNLTFDQIAARMGVTSKNGG